MTKTADHKAADVVIPPFRQLTDAALHSVIQIYASVPPTQESLAVLFAVDAAQTHPTEAWIGFFVETASAQLIWDVRPTGVLAIDDAAWVLARFDDAPSLSIMAMLIRLIEEAPRMPSDFIASVRSRARLFPARDTLREKTMRPTSVPYLRLVA